MKLKDPLRTIYKVDVLWLIRKWKQWRMSRKTQEESIKQTKELNEHVQKLINKAERRNGRINK